MEAIIQKRESFKDFHKKVNGIFEGFNTKESRHYKFQNTHMICICAGGRAGGTNEDVVEIFWGRSMPYKIEKHHKKDFTIETEYLHETGATLLYSMDERGRVIVLLYPPETKNIKPLEQAYLLDTYTDPKELQNKKRLKKHWKYFNAIMERNSLFGKPELIDKFRVFLIRNFKPKVLNNTIQKHSAFVNWMIKHTKEIIWIIIGGIITALISTYLIFR